MTQCSASSGKMTFLHFNFPDKSKHPKLDELRSSFQVKKIKRITRAGGNAGFYRLFESCVWLSNEPNLFQELYIFQQSITAIYKTKDEIKDLSFPILRYEPHFITGIHIDLETSRELDALLNKLIIALKAFREANAWVKAAKRHAAEFAIHEINDPTVTVVDQNLIDFYSKKYAVDAVNYYSELIKKKWKSHELHLK